MRIRPERVAEAMKRELADIIANKLRDPRLGAMISVTDVEVTSDLSMAKVYVSVLADDPERAKVMSALAHSTGFVRHELSTRIELREVPDLRFTLDTSIERGARVEELLKKIERGESIPDEDEQE
jgi:ribosome-binding factor A